MKNTIIASASELLLRDLTKLKQEIGSYKREESIWLISGDIKNSAGNLCLHLCGNLKHFIGTVLGKTNYVRSRDVEFSTRGVSKESLLKEIDTTMQSVQKTLTTLPPSALEQIYPTEVFGKPMTTGFFLIHLIAHLNYHLGQINYHRRLLEGAAPAAP